MSVIYRNSTAYGRTMAYGGFTPVGTIISLMGVSAPANYLKCDGTIYNITDYPDLANYFTAQFGTANKFGGDGVTTFAVPDLRGEFLRGTGTNSYTNQGNGANVGNHQDGTEIPYFGFNQDAGDLWTQTNAGKNLGVSLGVIKEDHLNTTAVRTGEYWRKTNTFSDSNGATTFTAKPTNTSVLYCIAYKDIYLADTPDINSVRRGWYVDGDNGSDSNNGRTPATAFKTLQMAINSAAPLPGSSYLGADNVGGDTIWVNCSATDPYDCCRILGKVVSIRAWDFTNNIEASNTATLRISNSQANPPFLVRYGATLYTYIAKISVTSTHATAYTVAVTDNSTWFAALNDNSTVKQVITITGGRGMECSRSSTIEIQGRGNTASELIISCSNGTGINVMRNSAVVTYSKKIDVRTSNGSAIAVNTCSVIQMGFDGTTASDPGSLYVRVNSGTGSAIQANQMSEVTSSNYTTVDLANAASQASSTVHAAQASQIHLTGQTYIKIVNNSTSASAIRSYNHSGVTVQASGTMTTNQISGTTASGSQYTIGAYGGYVMLTTGHTITGLNGLQATYGGRIAYNSITNNATTKTNTSSGGRIYSGTQSSIPNY